LGTVDRYLAYMECHRSQIYDFYYGSLWYLRKAWDSKKAQQAAYDCGIKAVLGLVGGSEGGSTTERTMLRFLPSV
ncbi:hypothetical protein BGX29_002538, partial [Mortierella sp. GBA35]